MAIIDGRVDELEEHNLKSGGPAPGWARAKFRNVAADLDASGTAVPVDSVALLDAVFDLQERYLCAGADGAGSTPAG